MCSGEGAVDWFGLLREDRPVEPDALDGGNQPA